MSDEIKKIAERIKVLREISQLSGETLAKKMDIPVEDYYLYESGEKDIPVSFLYEMARFFNVELTEILRGTSPKLKSYCLVRKNKGVRVERRTQYEYQSLADNFVHKKAEPFLVTVQPKKNEELDFNAHHGQEFNYVIEGKLSLVIDGHELELEAGDSVYYDSSRPHAMRAMDDRPARFLAVIM